MTHTILFVCTANICRSPMAHALFNAHAQRAGEADMYIARSAGTWGQENDPASTNAVAAMAQRGIDLSQHRGRAVTREILDDAAVIIVMTRNHYEALTVEFPKYRAKLHLMSELKSRNYDIADPYGSSLEDYELCAQELESLIASGYSKIKSWISDATPSRPS